jgi:hypothetical protein
MDKKKYDFHGARMSKVLRYRLKRIADIEGETIAALTRRYIEDGLRIDEKLHGVLGQERFRGDK